MSSTPTTSIPQNTRPPALLSPSAWAWLGVIGGLFVLLFWPFIQRMAFIATNANDWVTALLNLLQLKVQGDWSHALVIPFISLYFIAQHKDSLSRLRYRAFWPGLVVFFAGTFSFAWWLGPGRNDMLQGYSAILALLGLTSFLLGLPAMRVLWFPILYLSLAVKVAPRWWDMLSWNLRQIAATVAAFIINVLGIPLDFRADLHGTVIDLWIGSQRMPQPLDVEDACSGLRMLMAFIALGVAMAYLTPRLWWQRLIMVVLTVPIAIFVNVSRIVVLAFVRTYVNADMAQGDFHIFIGMLMLIPAAGLFWLLGWVLDHMVIQEDDPSAGNHAPSAASDGDATWKKFARSLGVRGVFFAALAVAGYVLAFLSTLSTLGMKVLPLAPVISATLAVASAAAVIVSFVVQWKDRPWRTVMGVGLFGALAAGAVGASYALGLGSIRPELLGLTLPHGLIVALLGVSLAAALGLFVTVAVINRRKLGRGWVIPACAAGMLLSAGLGLTGLVKASGLVLFKEPIPLRAPLIALSIRTEHWEMVQDMPRLGADEETTLGTREYIQRVYRSRVPLADDTQPVVRLHVAYYTGTPDTVPHVPERCYVANGLEAVGSPSYPLVPVSGERYQKTTDGWVARRLAEPPTVHLPTLEVPVTLFGFAPPNAPEQVSNVLYFFAANGKFLASPDRVRLSGFDPRDRYSYYCKIEVLILGSSTPAEAQKITGEFLSEMLPEIMALLPDWTDVRAGRWPEPTR